MEVISPVRAMNIEHHLEQASVWLSSCEKGANTTFLSYAAFELRLATERLALQYWSSLHHDGVAKKDLDDIRSFKRIEGRIYELGGNQREINALFSFNAIMLEMLGIPPFATPNVGRLKRYWQNCSELCHIAWTVQANDLNIRSEKYELLVNIRKELQQFINGLIGWPEISDETFCNLKDKFVAGQANADDVRAYLKKAGLWARYVPNDGGRASFVGKAVSPAKDDSE